MNPLNSWRDSEGNPTLTEIQIKELAQTSGLATIGNEGAKDTFDRMTLDVFYNGCPSYEEGSGTNFSTILQWANERNEVLRNGCNVQPADRILPDNLGVKTGSTGESSTTAALIQALVQAMTSKDQQASQDRENSLLKLLDGGSEDNHPLYKISTKIVNKIANNMCIALPDVRTVMPNASPGLYARKTPKSIRVVPATQLEATQKLRTVLAIMAQTHTADPEIQKNLREYEQEYADWWRIVTPAGVNALDMLFRGFWEKEFAKAPDTFKFVVNPPELAIKAAQLLTVHKLAVTNPSCVTCGSLDCLTATCQFSAPQTFGFAAASSSSPLQRKPTNLGPTTQTTCAEFNSRKGCIDFDCTFRHNCMHCGMRNHGAAACFKRHPDLKPGSGSAKRPRGISPPGSRQPRNNRRPHRREDREDDASSSGTHSRAGKRV